jgi:tetratricopeptide (TPR) repeat protein
LKGFRLFRKEITNLLAENTLFFAAFFTPLFFFTLTHDQFELPKLLLLAFILAALLILSIFDFPIRFPKDALSLSLLLFFGTQLFASLPRFSLSWTTSLLGDYENFAGLATLAVYLLWFWMLTHFLTLERIEKIFLFSVLAGLLSAIYAVAQHFGFDFIQWNPESVIASREFASLGNPNFLAAYLAMVIPFALWVLTRNIVPENTGTTGPSPVLSLFFIAGGALFLFLAGNGGQALLQINATSPLLFIFLAPGLLLISLGFFGFLSGQKVLLPLMALSILIIGLLTTASRGGFLAALAASCVFLALSAKDFGWDGVASALLGKTSRLSRFLFIGAALALFIFFGFSFFGRLFTSILHAGDSLAVSRLHIWRPALRIIAANPLHGVGLDTFKIAFPFYSGIEFNEIDGMFMSSRTAHDELLQITATTGFLGLAAYLSILFFFVRAWVTAYARGSARVKGLLLALFCCALAYQVQNLFSFGVSSINFLWFFCLAAVQKLSPASDPPSPPSAKPFLSRGLALLLALGLVYYSVTRLAADVAFAHGNAINDLLKHHDPNADPQRLIYYSNYGIQEIGKACGLCPLEVKYPLYMGLSYEERAHLDSAHEQDWLLRAQGFYREALRMSPSNAYYYNDLGRVETQLALYDKNDLAAAEKDYQGAVELAPASPYFRVNLSQALEAGGQSQEAQNQLDQAFALDPVFTGKILTQSALEKYQNGQKDPALTELTQALGHDPTNTTAYFYRGLIYLDEKKRKLARADLEKAKSLDPNNPQIDKFLAEAEDKK